MMRKKKTQKVEPHFCLRGLQQFKQEKKKAQEDIRHQGKSILYTLFMHLLRAFALLLVVLSVSSREAMYS